jgi:hypothetical protein
MGIRYFFVIIFKGISYNEMSNKSSDVACAQLEKKEDKYANYTNNTKRVKISLGTSRII